MPQDVISHWVNKAKSDEIVTHKPGGILVIKRVQPEHRAKAIIAISEKLWPWLMKLYEGARDDSGMLLHPSRIRAIALNVAQRLLKEQEKH